MLTLFIEEKIRQKARPEIWKLIQTNKKKAYAVIRTVVDSFSNSDAKRALENKRYSDTKGKSLLSFLTEENAKDTVDLIFSKKLEFSVSDKNSLLSQIMQSENADKASIYSLIFGHLDKLSKDDAKRILTSARLKNSLFMLLFNQNKKLTVRKSHAYGVTEFELPFDISNE
ncbi:MAG: hypothetical protein AAF335_00055 [Bacteroidota bacterium]